MLCRLSQLALIFALVLAALAPSRAYAQEQRAGLRVGANYNYLTGPSDPAGDPTLLYGSAFAGVGFIAGAYYEHGLTPLLSIELGLTYARHAGTGYAEDKKNNQKQSLSLSAHTLHVPLLVRLRQPVGGVTLLAGLGPELLWTLASSSTITYEGIDAQPTPLATADPLHVGLSAALGVAIPFGKGSLPIELRTIWDPMVPGSTRERFDNYKDLNNPGNYQVAFNWQFILSVGAELEL